MHTTHVSEENFTHFKHKAGLSENYFLTIVDVTGMRTLNLGDFNQPTITFGRSTSNDIVISSDAIDDTQGYLEFTPYGILAVNTSQTIPMLGNNNHAFKELYLSEGTFIKIFHPEQPSLPGVLFIMSIGENIDEWSSYTLQLGRNTLGANSHCDIVLPPLGINKTHASIYYQKKKIILYDEHSTNGTYVNGQNIANISPFLLHNLDVIYIGNSKLILYENKIIYQILEKGVQVDAIDIVKRVRIKWKQKVISSHVNMQIKPSEFVAFVGGSGAGKSTFMKCISGVTKPTSGTVLINGEDLYENYDTIKYNIGYVPQEDIVFANLTLQDMLQYAAKLRMPENTSSKERAIRIKEVLDIVQLTPFENSYIRQLSGGQRKRASIAVELLANPSLFFLDEPTSGLDPGTERSIMMTLKDMSKMGKTIILVTHNTLNLHLCDKVAFFGSGGRLCFFGTPQEALDFYGVTDFVDIYTLLNENTDEWYEKFNTTYSNSIPSTPVQTKKRNKVAPQKKSFFKQLLILIKRYIKLISNDVQQLLLLFAQAPIIALLLATIAPSEVYSTYDDTKVLLFCIGCASIWLGLLNSVQEICKEKVILEKEYMADLKLSSYLFSKYLVQGCLAFIQATIVVLILQGIIGQSTYSILINPFWDMQIICFLSIFCASAIGLFISSIVKNSNIAISITPLLLVPQLLYSGMLFKLEGISDFISNFILCRWTVEGFGTSANLNELTHMVQLFNPMATVEPEAYFDFTSEHMIQIIGILILMMIVLLVTSYIFLKRNLDKDS